MPTDCYGTRLPFQRRLNRESNRLCLEKKRDYSLTKLLKHAGKHASKPQQWSTTSRWKKVFLIVVNAGYICDLWLIWPIFGKLATEITQGVNWAKRNAKTLSRFLIVVEAWRKLRMVWTSIFSPEISSAWRFCRVEMLVSLSVNIFRTRPLVKVLSICLCHCCFSFSQIFRWTCLIPFGHEES